MSNGLYKLYPFLFFSFYGNLRQLFSIYREDLNINRVMDLHNIKRVCRWILSHKHKDSTFMNMREVLLEKIKQYEECVCGEMAMCMLEYKIYLDIKEMGIAMAVEKLIEKTEYDKNLDLLILDVYDELEGPTQLYF